MRQIFFIVYDDSISKAERKEGFFHGWGQEYEVKLSGAGMRTVGICEDSVGKIWTVSPRRVHFVEPYQQYLDRLEKVQNKSLKPNQ